MKKICSKCKIEKELSEFHKESRGKFGVKATCSKCTALRSNKWREENSDRDKENKRAWNLNNKEYHKSLTYKWREENSKKHNKYVADYQRNRKKIDPLFKLKCNFRSLLSNHLTRSDYKKHNKVEGYLSCSFCEFKQYIENLFDIIMTWDNYGSYWSIDHICPCDQAQDSEEFTKLQHYSNLQPIKICGYNGNSSKSNNKTKEAEELCVLLLNRPWIDLI